MEIYVKVWVQVAAVVDSKYFEIGLPPHEVMLPQLLFRRAVAGVELIRRIGQVKDESLTFLQTGKREVSKRV